MADGRPRTRALSAPARAAVAELFRSRGLALAKNTKNKYIAFEVRTAGRSIFTLYTSGKLVTTVRADDAEGLQLEDLLAQQLGDAPEPRERSPASAPSSAGDAPVLAGLDETGTGEIIGLALVAGALFPRELSAAVAAVAGHVETKSSRAASGWERLGEDLAGLRRQGLVLTALPISNRLFDVYSKNALLDLAYVRAVSNLRCAAGAAHGRLHLAVDDYGAGALLSRACALWRGGGHDVALVNKADDLHLAARVASVWARSARSRELAGLNAEVDDGPLGSGNPGHFETRGWLRRRARAGAGRSAPWPSFVKTSFSTVTRLTGGEPATKIKPPLLPALLGDEGAASLLAGRLDLTTLQLPAGQGSELRTLQLTPEGECCTKLAAAPLLPLLFGGLVLDEVAHDLSLLDRLLQRETGLASGWRVLCGPTLDSEDVVHRTLLAAHRRGVIQLEPCAEADPRARATAHGALRLASKADDTMFSAVLV